MNKFFWHKGINILSKTRYNNYDLLRLISIIAVIVIHVNYLYFRENITPTWNYSYLFESFINIITRFSVPCFVMLSGAFNLHNNKNKNFKYFYKKNLFKIIIPFIIISLIIWIFSQVLNGYKGVSPKILFGIWDNWFIEMIIGLYLLTPILIRLKESISIKIYRNFIIVLLLWSIISSLFSSFSKTFAIGFIVEYIPYYLVGNYIFENTNKLTKRKIILLLIFLITIWLLNLYSLFYVNNFDMITPTKVFFSPFVALASITVFIIFTNIKIKFKTNSISQLSLYIYLFHVPFINIAYSIIDPLFNSILLKELLITLGVFIISVLCSYIFCWLSMLVKYLLKPKRQKK